VLPRAIARHRLASVSLALAVALAAALAAALPALTASAAVIPVAAPPAVHYVALGDSYSAGVGAGDYISSSGSCERSTLSYPALWAAAHHPASYVSEACSMATSSSVISGQLSALSKSTTLVSITIGGNDVGFVPVMATCVVLPTSFCVTAVQTAEAMIQADLPAELNQVLAAIHADAPNATVVVLSYPEPYDMARSASCSGLSGTDRSDLNQAASQLDAQLKAAAGRYGDVFADVRPYFAGHQICDSGAWLNAVDWLDLGVSYHPTAAGQSGAYFPAFSERAQITG
jgi:lysophospholipase L1-like esterase